MLETCKSCNRTLYGEGVLPVEATKQQDGKSFVVEQLEALSNSSNTEDQERYDDLVARFEQLAAEGTLAQPRMYRSLHTREGLWEIKHGTSRVGCYESTVSDSHSRAIRLTHFWTKDKSRTAENKTPLKQKNFGDRLIREDREYIEH